MEVDHEEEAISDGDTAKAKEEASSEARPSSNPVLTEREVAFSWQMICANVMPGKEMTQGKAEDEERKWSTKDEQARFINHLFDATPWG